MTFMKRARIGALSSSLVLLLCAGVVAPRPVAAQADRVSSKDAEEPPAAVEAGEEIPEVQEAVERFQRNDMAGALEKLQEARAAHDELPPAKLMLARLLLSSNQQPAGRALLEEVTAEDPDYPVTYIIFGNLALAEGRVTDALLQYEKARALVGKAGLTETQQRDVRVQALSGLAAVAERRRDWTTARQVLVELVKLTPNDGPARQRLGRALFGLGDRDEALTQLDYAVQLDEDLDPPGIAMGWLLADQGKWDEALDSMEEAVKQEPRSAGAQLGLATFLLQRERAEEARPHAETALELAPDSLPAQRLLGAIAYRLKDHETAETQLDAVLKAAPEDVATNNLRALVLADKPDQESRQRAVEVAEQNVQRAPQNPQALATLGWAYYRVGRLDEALKALQAATPGGQATPDTAYFMACVLADQGQDAEALRLLRSALDAPPGQFAARADARRRLEQLAQEATRSDDAEKKADAP